MLTDPNFYARIGGFFYLFIIAAGIFSQFFVRSNLIVKDNPSRTTDNILQNETIFRTGFVVEVIMFGVDVALSGIFFLLLQKVSFEIALLTALFRFTAVIILTLNMLNHFAALLIAKKPEFESEMPFQHKDELAYFFLRLHSSGYHLGLIFFGIHCLLLGWMIIEAAFLPWIIGLLLILAGIAYLINSLSTFGAPKLAARIPGLILLPPLIAELSLALWLLIMGVSGHPGL